MEELLNKLIKRGWKPFELSYRGSYDFEFKDNGHTLVSCHSNEDDEYTSFDRYSWRDLVSKESGLWQFVCENNLIQTEHYNGERAKNVYYEVDEYDEEGDIIQTGDMEGDKFIGMYDYEYRLIESALCSEEALEKFLLDNIKVS